MPNKTFFARLTWLLALASIVLGGMREISYEIAIFLLLVSGMLYLSILSDNLRKNDGNDRDNTP